MAWFWERKKEEKEKANAQKQTEEKKRGLASKAGKKEAAKNTSKSKKIEKAKADSDKKTAEAPKVAKQPKPETTGDAYRVIIGPVITEKSARLAEQGTYVFAVMPGSNKIVIAKAVKAVYGVDPTKVTIANIAGKAKNFAQKKGRRPSRHKAYVTVKKGQSIELFEHV